MSATGGAASAADPARPGTSALGGTGAFGEAAKDFAALAPALWDRLAAATITAVDPRPGEQVLDACCGTGASALPAAQRVGPLGRVLGLVDVEVREAHLELALDADLIWLLVTGSGFRGALSGLSDDQVRAVRDRLVTTLEGTVLDATSLVGTGTWTG